MCNLRAFICIRIPPNTSKIILGVEVTPKQSCRIAISVIIRVSLVKVLVDAANVLGTPVCTLSPLNDDIVESHTRFNDGISFPLGRNGEGTEEFSISPQVPQMPVKGIFENLNTKQRLHIL